MAKAPQAGLAKTRLIAKLGSQGAADLAKAMFQHTLNIVLASHPDAVECCVTPGPDHPAFESISSNPRVSWQSQIEGDLGQRMAAVAARVINEGESVILLGTDCPMLDRQHVREAVRSLQSHDAVVIPVDDGGYCLLGLQQFHHSVFDNIAWSTGVVAEQTRKRIQNLHWSLAEMQALHDIDNPDDLLFVPPQIWDSCRALSLKTEKNYE